jgi:hypothetical protein
MSAHAQCVRMVGSGQIVCPAYPNSTPPVTTRPGGYGLNYGGVVGAGQVIYGVGTAAVSGYKGNSVGMTYGAATAARGVDTVRNNPPLVYRPQIAVPAQRPSEYRR